MPRKLKFHEQKLLKKVDLYKDDRNVRVTSILHKYHVAKREDYTRYNRLAGLITKITRKLINLDAKDPFRVERTDSLLEKLYHMGLIPTTKNLELCDKITASAFCRRRLPVVMMRLKMAETLSEASKLIEQGHIRVGPNTVTDTAFLVTRPMEDFVTWVDTSKIKKTIQRYNDKLDDYDLL